jgi:hypothetical protein
MSDFIRHTPELASYWRAIILFGRNSASYKFALAKALFDLAGEGKTAATLSELAVPYSRHLRAHLEREERQCTAPSSKFLDACRAYNAGEIGKQELVDRTVRLGFNNVLDAFHVVGGEEVAPSFFEEGEEGRIVLTDDLFELRERAQAESLRQEVEARWRLVETAWSTGVPKSALQVRRDSGTNELYVYESGRRRRNITSSRDALNGYQKGRCFYCFRGIAVGEEEGQEKALIPPQAEVDHFFPVALNPYLEGAYLDGVWNLVLSCPQCNRGPGGKMDQIPEPRYLARLERRNNYLIESHHPLKETLKKQTGSTEKRRRDFLKEVDRAAINYAARRWQPDEEYGDGVKRT